MCSVITNWSGFSEIPGFTPAEDATSGTRTSHLTLSLIPSLILSLILSLNLSLIPSLTPSLTLILSRTLTRILTRTLILIQTLHTSILVMYITIFSREILQGRLLKNYRKKPTMPVLDPYSVSKRARRHGYREVSSSSPYVLTFVHHRKLGCGGWKNKVRPAPGLMLFLPTIFSLDCSTAKLPLT